MPLPVRPVVRLVVRAPAVLVDRLAVVFFAAVFALGDRFVVLAVFLAVFLVVVAFRVVAISVAPDARRRFSYPTEPLPLGALNGEAVTAHELLLATSPAGIADDNGTSSRHEMPRPWRPASQVCALEQVCPFRVKASLVRIAPMRYNRYYRHDELTRLNE